MARADDQLKFRVQPALKDLLLKAADENHRSLNAEITTRLERSFDLPSEDERAVDRKTFINEMTIMKVIRLLQNMVDEVDLQDIQEERPKAERHGHDD